MLLDKINKIIKISYLAILFLIPVYFAFNKGSFNIFELNKLIIFKILLIVMLLASLSKVFLFKSKVNIIQKKYKTFSLFLILFFIFYLINLFFSIHPIVTWWGSYDRQQGLYTLIYYFVFFILLIINIKTWIQIKEIIMTIISASFLVCFYGLTQYFDIDPLFWTEKAIDTGRIFSSLGQPNFLGHYLIMIIPLTIFSLIFIGRSFLIRFFISSVILLQFICLFLTGSRSAILGFLAGFYFFVILFLFSKYRKKIGLIFISISLFLSIFIFFLSTNSLRTNLFNQDDINKPRSIINLNSGSVKIRIYYWQAAIREFKQANWKRKLIGYGGETQSKIFFKHYQPAWGVHEGLNVIPDRAHNLFFDIILQFGIIGLLMIILFYGYIVALAIGYLENNKNKKNQFYWLVVALLIILISYFVNNLFSFSTTVTYVYFYLILALLLIIIKNKNLKKIKTYQDDLNLRLNYKLFFYLIIFVIGLNFIYYHNINFWLADQYYMKAKKGEVSNDCPVILNNIEKTISLNPNSIFYQKEYIYYNLNCLESVEDMTKKAFLIENVINKISLFSFTKYDFYNKLQIADTYLVLGRIIDQKYYNLAEKYYQELIEINPYFSLAYKNLGKLKKEREETEKAINNFQKAIGVLPGLDNIYLNRQHGEMIKKELFDLYKNLAEIYENKKNYQLARKYYLEIIKLNPYYLVFYKKIADTYYIENNLTDALKYIQRGYMLNTSDDTWITSMNIIYEKMGDDEKKAKKISN